MARQYWSERPEDFWERLWMLTARGRSDPNTSGYPMCMRCGHQIYSPHDAYMDGCGDLRHDRECGVPVESSTYARGNPWDLYGQDIDLGGSRMRNVQVSSEFL